MKKRKEEAEEVEEDEKWNKNLIYFVSIFVCFYYEKKERFEKLEKSISVRI